MKRKEVYQWVLNNCFTKDGKNINSAFLRWCKEDELHYINKITNHIEAPIGYRITKFLLDDLTLDKCVVCGNVIKYHPVKSIHCSISCSKLSKMNQIKVKQTCLNKYGVDHPAKSKEVQDKKKQTCLNKYGVDTPFHSKIIQDKVKQTCLNRYGVDNISHIQDTKDKKKIQFENLTPEQKKLSNEKSFNTMIDNMGIRDTLASKEWLNCRYTNDKKTIIQISKETGVSPKCVYDWLLRHDIKILRRFVSGKEQEVVNYINSIYKGTVDTSNRSVISPYELDIYLPDINMAIEFNGLYWHSYNKPETSYEKNYHRMKTDMCNDVGITLIHIFEDDWDLKQDIIKSMISYKLGKSETIYARKCKIKHVSTKEQRMFLNNNHLQGYTHSSTTIGLYYKDCLVSLMSFGKPRFNKTCEHELIRYVTKINKRIVGGASKMFKHFINTHKGSVLSYSDISFSNGGIYQTLGFKNIGFSGISFYYVKDGIRHNRLKYQKHKLNRLLDNFDADMSSSKNMFNNGFRRIWNCGNSKWLYHIP